MSRHPQANSLWGYVYDNTGFPVNMQTFDNPLNTEDPCIYKSLLALAGPSNEMRSKVQCIASKCRQLSDSDPFSSNACQCSAWQLACVLSNETSSLSMRNFCGLLARNASDCASISPRLLHSTSATTSLPIINSCFPRACDQWGYSKCSPHPRGTPYGSH